MKACLIALFLSALGLQVCVHAVRVPKSFVEMLDDEQTGLQATEIDCNVLRSSVAGGSFPKGCAGAVWSNGSPSSSYCSGKSGAYPWYAECCEYKNSKCQPKWSRYWKAHMKYSSAVCVLAARTNNCGAEMECLNKCDSSTNAANVYQGDTANSVDCLKCPNTQPPNSYGTAYQAWSRFDQSFVAPTPAPTAAHAAVSTSSYSAGDDFYLVPKVLQTHLLGRYTHAGKMMKGGKPMWRTPGTGLYHWVYLIYLPTSACFGQGWYAAGGNSLDESKPDCGAYAFTPDTSSDQVPPQGGKWKISYKGPMWPSGRQMKWGFDVVELMTTEQFDAYVSKDVGGMKEVGRLYVSRGKSISNIGYDHYWGLIKVQAHAVHKGYADAGCYGDDEIEWVETTPNSGEHIVKCFRFWTGGI